MNADAMMRDMTLILMRLVAREDKAAHGGALRTPRTYDAQAVRQLVEQGLVKDVGGPYGFQEFLQTITDESDPEYQDMWEWGASQLFEPFNLQAASDRMRKWFDGSLADDWDAANGR